jgi:peptidoglycan/xylan/chitin deacetylase (PgdA/CDA1 family)
MPDHERYPYRSTFNREPIEWPKRAKLAFYVGINIEYYHFDRKSREGPQPDVINHVMWEYGARVGVFRIMDVLDKHEIRASVLLNSDVCLYQSDIIQEGNKRNWEWLGHGITNSRSMPSYGSEVEERTAIREVRDTIESHTGTRPKGWLGPGLAETFHTPDLLAGEGFEYVCDWSGDDQPLPMRVETGRLIAMPYHNGVNDQRLVARAFFTGPEYQQAVQDQFDTLYAAALSGGGLVMGLPIHPPNVGLPFRLKYLDQAISYICGHEKVWLTTSGDISDWYYKHYYKKPSST